MSVELNSCSSQDPASYHAKASLLPVDGQSMAMHQEDGEAWHKALPAGTHAVEFEAKDGAGNTDYCSSLIQLW
jgi:hypothetical protein